MKFHSGGVLIVLPLIGCLPLDRQVRTVANAESLRRVREAKLDVRTLDAVGTDPAYGQAIARGYRSEAGFREAFTGDLCAMLPAHGSQPASRLELTHLWVGGRVGKVRHTRFADTDPEFTRSAYYHCRVILQFKVVDDQGGTVLAGTVEAESAPDLGTLPEEVRLDDALLRLRVQLVEFLSGRMPSWRIGRPRS